MALVYNLRKACFRSGSGYRCEVFTCWGRRLPRVRLQLRGYGVQGSDILFGSLFLGGFKGQQVHVLHTHSGRGLRA